MEVLFGLRCGRGDAARQLLKLDHADALDMLIDCVTNDPRVDSQVESRDLYYARSLIDIGASAAALEPHLFPADLDRQPDDERDTLTLAVLGRLAVNGDRQAVQLLRRYVRDGFQYESALSELAELDDDAVFDGLADIAINRYVEDEASIYIVDEGRPWTLWRDHKFVAQELLRLEGHAQVQQQEGETRQLWDTNQYLIATDQMMGWSHWFARELAHRFPNDRTPLLEAIKSAGVGARSTALIALGYLNDNAVLDIAPAVLLNDSPTDTDRWFRAAWQAMRRMRTPEALDWARRQNLSDLNGSIASMAAGLLADAGVESDRETILDLLSRSAVEAEDPSYLLCNLVEAVERLQLSEATGIISDVYGATRYSYLRSRCVQALEACGGSDDELRTDWLWDCEEQTRLAGVQHAPSSLVVSSRLRRLASEAAEERGVRNAAHTRLGSG